MSICEYVTNVLKKNNYLKSFLYDCLKRPTLSLTDCNPPEGDSAMKGFAIVPYIQGILGLQSISWDVADNVSHPRRLDPTLDLITYIFVVLYLQHGRHDVKCKPSIAEPIRRVRNNCGIKVALKPFRTLRHIFAKPKDRVPTDRKTHAVYSIPCGDCDRISGSNNSSKSASIAQNQLWLSTCVKQAITLRGKILESLPLTIVMVNGFVWKPGISVRALVP